MKEDSPSTGRKLAYPAEIQSGLVESSNLPVAGEGNRELCRVRASWLTQLFRDELIVQEKTISIIRNSLLVSFVETMPVRDIGRVVYVDAPFFAGIQILGKNVAHELNIHGLPKNKAREARDIIEQLLLEQTESGDQMQWIGFGPRHVDKSPNNRPPTI